MPVINFANAEDRGGFEAFSGRHHVKITEVSDTEVKNSGGKLVEGTPGWNIRFTVQEGPYEGRHVWNNFWFAPSTLGFLKNMLVATGQWTMEDLSHEIDVDEDELLGLDLEVSTKIRPETDQYDARTEIKGYKPYDPGKDYSAQSQQSNASMMP